MPTAGFGTSTHSHAHEVVRFDPRTGRQHVIHLNSGRTPYPVELGPDGALWLTEDCVDYGMLRIDPRTLETTEYLKGTVGTAGIVRRRGHLWFLGASADGYGLFEVNGIRPTH